MNYSDIEGYVQTQFKESIIPTLCEYIKIDNLSPAYDKECLTNGKAEKAANLMLSWVKSQSVSGLTAEIIKSEGHTPLIFIEIPPSDKNISTNVLMYGHFDKQPHFTGWREGLGPCTPVIEGDFLTGVCRSASK